VCVCVYMCVSVCVPVCVCVCMCMCVCAYQDVMAVVDGTNDKDTVFENVQLQFSTVGRDAEQHEFRHSTEGNKVLHSLPHTAHSLPHTAHFPPHTARYHPYWRAPLLRWIIRVHIGLCPPPHVCVRPRMFMSAVAPSSAWSLRRWAHSKAGSSL
jgi:hypothetical protein